MARRNYVLNQDLTSPGRYANICRNGRISLGQRRFLRLFSRLDPEQLRSEPADDPTAETTAEMARLEGVKKQLAELAGAGKTDLVDYQVAKAANDRAMQVLRETMARSADQEALERTRAEALDLRAKWDDLGIDSRRRVVRALAERIEVGPAVRGRNFYSRDRVRITHR